MRLARHKLKYKSVFDQHHFKNNKGECHGDHLDLRELMRLNMQSNNELLFPNMHRSQESNLSKNNAIDIDLYENEKKRKTIFKKIQGDTSDK